VSLCWVKHKPSSETATFHSNTATFHNGWSIYSTDLTEAHIMQLICASVAWIKNPNIIFWCIPVITNQFYTVQITKMFCLFLGSPPGFQQFLSSLAARVGSDATFQCTIVGTPAPTITWWNYLLNIQWVSLRSRC